MSPTIEQAAEAVVSDSVQKLIERALELYRNKEHALYEYMVFLIAIEQSGEWRAVTPDSFAEFLKRYRLGTADEYARFKLAHVQLTEDVVKAIGVKAAEQLSRIGDDKQRAEATSRLMESSHEKGAPVSEHRARQVVAEYIGISSKVAQRLSVIEKLQAENEKLRAELDFERSYAETLRAELKREGGRPMTREQFRRVRQGKASPKEDRSQTSL